MKDVRKGLIAVVAVAGAVIAARMVAGPFPWVRTPLNAEGWFAVAVTVMVALQAGKSRGAAGSGRGTAVTIAALAALTAAAYWRVGQIGFLSDDFVLVHLGNTFHFDAKQVLATPNGDGFFRPVTYAAMAVVAPWLGYNAGAWHAAMIGLHFVNVVLVYLLAMRMGASRFAAGIAGALFAIHGTRPEAAVWIAGRADLLATFFVLAGLLVYFRSTWAALVLMVLAILTKESAYVFPLLVLLIEWREKRKAIPFFAGAAVLFAYRLWLFHGVGGYRNGTAFGLGTLKALGLRLWMALYFPINWSVEPGIVLAVLGAGYLVALGWLAARSRPDARMVWFGLAFLVIAALPPVSLLVIGAGLANARVLYLPVAGFAAFLGAAVAGLEGRARYAVAAAIVVFHFAVLQHDLSSWVYASERAQESIGVARNCIAPEEAVRASILPDRLRDVPFLGNGLRQAMELRGAGAMPIGGTLGWGVKTDRATCAPR